MQKKFSLIVGVGLSLVAIFLLNTYLMNERKTMEERLSRTFKQQVKDLVTILVATKDIRRGTEMTSDLVAPTIVPNKFVEPQAVTAADRIMGMKAAIDIKQGQQITLNKLITPREAMGRSLAMATPVGKRAITISVDNISGLAGMITPGDYVDVIGLLPIPTQTPDGGQTVQIATIPLFQKVIVLAVGSELLTDKEEEEKRGVWSSLTSRSQPAKKQEKSSPLMTLALSPQEASLLAFVSEQGRIRLVLRSPADAKTEILPPANWETLFQHINSMLPAQKQTIRERIIREPGQIEVYRGTNRGQIEKSD